jgi:hypothetical protein
MEADLAVADRVDRRRGELVHAHEPLQRDERLDPLARAVGEGHVVGVGLARAQQALGLERRDDRLACASATRRPGEWLAGGFGHATVLADHRDDLEVVAAADLEVVGVVPRV